MSSITEYYKKTVVSAEVLEELLNHQYHSVKEEALDLPGITYEHLEGIFEGKYTPNHDPEDLQIKAAAHPAILRGRLMKCLKTDNERIAMSAASNPALTTEDITEYVGWLEQNIRTLKHATARVAVQLSKHREISAISIARLVRLFQWGEVFTKPSAGAFHAVVYALLKKEGLR